MKRTAVCALAMALVMMPQPCLAADDIQPFYSPVRESAVFAGAKIAVPLGRGATTAPRAGLQLTAIHHYRDAASPTRLASHRSPGLQFAFGQSKKPTLLVAGQSQQEVKRRLGISDTTKWVIIGGVVVMVIVAVALSSSGGCLGPSMEDDC